MADKMLLSTTASWEIVVRRAVAGALLQLKAIARAMRHRREILGLAELDDRALKDIGLTRVEVAGALAEPFHKDPSRMLLVRSVERRARARAMAVTPERCDDQEIRAA